MDHLVCFLAGSLALGAFTDPGGIDSARAQSRTRDESHELSFPKTKRKDEHALYTRIKAPRPRVYDQTGATSAWGAL